MGPLVIQGYFPQLTLGTYSRCMPRAIGPKGGGGSYERGHPVLLADVTVGTMVILGGGLFLAATIAGTPL